MLLKGDGKFYPSDGRVYGFISREQANRPPDNTNLPSSQVSDFYVPYVVPDFASFIQCFEYYRTLGKVQNVVDSIVANIINREWYFESDKPTRIKIMEDWEERFDLSRVIEQMVRDWLIFGNSILGYSDWQPMQMSTILGIKRDIYGRPEYFVQTVNGKVVDIDAKPFLFTKFIEINRDSWGKPLFCGLISSNYTDIDGNQPVPHLQNYRQVLLDAGRLIHKQCSPRSVWAYDGASPESLEKDIKPLHDAMRPGDRLVTNRKPDLITEQINVSSRFANFTELIINDTEAGLQSSENRLITQPSAMADAREAGAQDDDRVLGIMEKVRRTINKYIIPRVVGEANVCFFKWGAKDTIELEMPDGLMNAVKLGILSIAEARMNLSLKGWKLDDGLFQQDINQQVWQLKAYNYMLQQKMGMGGQGGPPTLPAEPEPAKTLTGKEPTPMAYNPSAADLDTNISGQGDMPPYRAHVYWPAGTYPNKRPPNATQRGTTAGNPFVSQIPFGGSRGEKLTELDLKYGVITKEGRLVYRGGRV
jgi:hypothetical protein